MGTVSLIVGIVGAGDEPLGMAKLTSGDRRARDSDECRLEEEHKGSIVVFRTGWMLVRWGDIEFS